MNNNQTTTAVIVHVAVIAKDRVIKDVSELVPESSIDQLHESYSQNHPDCWVNFQWGKNNFICGMRWAEKQDSALVAWGIMDFASFTKKWYPEQLN